MWCVTASVSDLSQQSSPIITGTTYLLFCSFLSDTFIEYIMNTRRVIFTRGQFPKCLYLIKYKGKHRTLWCKDASFRIGYLLACHKAVCVCFKQTCFDFRENKPKNGSICVANHTTPIDVIILANDGCYSLVQKIVFLYEWLITRLFEYKRWVQIVSFSWTWVELVSQIGQAHGGLLGMVQRAMVKSSPHIWFDRSEVKDRHLVAKR